MKRITLIAILAIAPTLAAAHNVGEAGDNVSTGHDNAQAAVDNNQSEGRAGGAVGFHPNTDNVGK